MSRDPKYLAAKFGLTFNHPELLATALTHRSAGAGNNERLEFLGDSILGFVVAELLYETYPSSAEGVLSRLRASIVNQESLAALAREHQLGDYLVLGSGELKSGGFRRDSILSDAFEAMIGALYLDQGFDVCKLWLKQLLLKKMETMALDKGQKDPKTQLQELMQARRCELPEYTLLTMSGLPHEQTFKVKCAIPLLQEAAIGTGGSRKRAEQAAAEQMLQMLGKIFS